MLVRLDFKANTKMKKQIFIIIDFDIIVPRMVYI